MHGSETLQGRGGLTRAERGGSAMNFVFSPFIVPVAGCMVGIVAIVAGISLDGNKRRIKSQERIAMIARGVPLAEIEKMLGAGDEKPPVKDPLRSLGNARRTGGVLVSVGGGLSLFFFFRCYFFYE